MDKIKVMFFAANPGGTVPLKLDEEARAIDAKIRAAEHRDALQFITAWAVQPDDLLQKLNEHRPHIVHFSGHGTKAAQLVLVGGDGTPRPVSKAALVSLFRNLKGNIRVVVFNACYSRPQAEAIVEMIDCVVGMNTAIGDEAAIKFAASFYRALGFGRSVREAFGQGRTSLLLEGIPEETTPELLVRDGVNASQVVLINPSQVPEDGARGPAPAVEESGTLWFYKRSEHDRFIGCLRERLSEAKNIVMIGSGLAVLGHPTLARSLMERAARRECHVEIFMADPFSPAVETRLIEEELGKLRPPDGKPGLLGRLNMLLKSWVDAGRPETLSLHLFTNYPTFSLIIIDKDYFVYPYSYATLGNFSPVMRFSRDLPDHVDTITFLDEHYARVKLDALDAEDILKARDWIFPAIEQLCPLAVYLVPPRDSPLYGFGTEVLGYDVRQRQSVDSPWRDQVGRAGDYGFHLTVCDVLYFLSPPESRKAIAEVEYLAREIPSFSLTDLKVKPRHPSDRAISLAVQDPTGQLEALHHELVHRVYRRAVATDYTLGLAQPDRGKFDERCKTMIRRYHAPYILKRFEPHFTLLANVPPDKQKGTSAELNKLFVARVLDKTFQVNQLAIMSRDSRSARWYVAKEMSLRSL